MAREPPDASTCSSTGTSRSSRSASSSTRTRRARSGLTPQDVAQTLQTLLSGDAVTQYREGEEQIDVVARAVPSERLELGRLKDLHDRHPQRRRRAAVAGRARQLRVRGAGPVAAQPRHGDHRARAT